jgi:transposase-like protein
VTKPKKEKAMTPKQNNNLSKPARQAQVHELMKERMLLAIRQTMLTILDEEVEGFVQAGLYERTSERQDQRNGSYERDLGTSFGEIEKLRVPRTRKGFRSELFERYKRRQAELDTAICDMFVQGVSTEKVGQVVSGLSGIQPSPSTVSRVFHTLEGEFEEWKKRSLQSHYRYVFADGTYFSVIYDQESKKMPILAVIGIDLEGKKELLGFTVGERENQKAWEDLLQDLKDRGLASIDLWITDGNQTMINAVQIKYPEAKRQRCVKHKIENVLGYIPKTQQEQVRPELLAIFYQLNQEKAQQEAAAFMAKYETIYPTAVECLRRDLPACLTFYEFPETHWRYIRTTNIIERLFLEVKKRSKKMSAAFRNENSCTLLFYAVIRSLKLRKISIPASPANPSVILHNS